MDQFHCDGLQFIEQGTVSLNKLNYQIITIDTSTYSLSDYSSIVIKCTIVDKFSEIEHNPVFFASYQEQTVNEDRVQKNIEQNSSAVDYYYDFDAYATRNSYHFIKLPYSQSQIYLYFIDFKDSAPQEISYQVNLSHSNEICYKQCSSCNEKQHCECSDNYVGENCQYNYSKLKINKEYTIDKPIYQRKVWAFDVENKNTYQIEFSFPDQFKCQIQYYFKYYTDIDYPNYEVNSFITKNDTYQIKFSEEIIKEYIEYLDTSKSNQKPIVIFSMYAASSTDDKNLNFQLKINQESTSNKNQEWVIILWFCIGIVIFLSLTLFCVYLCYRNKSFVGTNDNLRQVVPQENGRKLLKVMITQVSIEKYMPFMPYSEILENVPELSDQTECIVCLLNFSPEEQCRLTVCFHIFHKQCLDTWVKKNGNCPFCRHGLTRKIFENKQKLYTEFENNTFAQKILEKTMQNQTQDNQYEYEDEEEIEQTNMEHSIQFNQFQQQNITQLRPLNVQESEQVEQVEQEEGKFNSNNIDDNSNNNISNNNNINYSSYTNIQNQQQQFLQMGNLVNVSSTRSFKLQNSNGKQKIQLNNDIQNLDTQDVSSSRQESFYKRMKSFDFLFDKSLIRSTSVKQKNKQFISKSPHKLYKSQLSTKAFSLDQGQNGLNALQKINSIQSNDSNRFLLQNNNSQNNYTENIGHINQQEQQEEQKEQNEQENLGQNKSPYLSISRQNNNENNDQQNISNLEVRRHQFTIQQQIQISKRRLNQRKNHNSQNNFNLRVQTEQLNEIQEEEEKNLDNNNNNNYSFFNQQQQKQQFNNDLQGQDIPNQYINTEHQQITDFNNENQVQDLISQTDQFQNTKTNYSQNTLPFFKDNDFNFNNNKNNKHQKSIYQKTEPQIQEDQFINQIQDNFTGNQSQRQNQQDNNFTSQSNDKPQLRLSSSQIYFNTSNSQKQNQKIQQYIQDLNLQDDIQDKVQNSSQQQKKQKDQQIEIYDNNQQEQNIQMVTSYQPLKQQCQSENKQNMSESQGNVNKSSYYYKQNRKSQSSTKSLLLLQNDIQLQQQQQQKSQQQFKNQFINESQQNNQNKKDIFQIKQMDSNSNSKKNMNLYENDLQNKDNDLNLESYNNLTEQN